MLISKGTSTLLIVYVLTIITLIKSVETGSCKAAKLCCEGRDSGCVIQKASPNAIIETPKDKPCYCDQACLKLGDCCYDFNETCSVADCKVSEWSEWTRCDNRCGIGNRTRRRFIIEDNRNGGKPCPETEQTLSCENYEACQRRARHFQILASNFSSAKSVKTSFTSDYSVSQDVTQGYCVIFRILNVSKRCRRILESLREGNEMCVWCKASKYEDSESWCEMDMRENRSRFTGIGKWEMINTPIKHCHGKWMSNSRWTSLENCEDSICQKTPTFVFA